MRDIAAPLSQYFFSAAVCVTQFFRDRVSAYHAWLGTIKLLGVPVVLTHHKIIDMFYLRPTHSTMTVVRWYSCA